MDVERIRRRCIEFGRLLRDYNTLFLAGAILFGMSVFLPSPSVQSAPPQTCDNTLLCTHGTTPWGVFTSIFLYDSWQNIPAYFLILVAYVSFSDALQTQERLKRARFASMTIFAAALFANALWLLARPTTFSWGPSGVVYALWGVLFAFTLTDGMPKHANHLDPRTWYEGKKERDTSVGNLALFASTALFLFLEPAQFLSAGPGINVFAHGVSFLGGFFLAQVYLWNRKLEE